MPKAKEGAGAGGGGAEGKGPITIPHYPLVPNTEPIGAKPSYRTKTGKRGGVLLSESIPGVQTASFNDFLSAAASAGANLDPDPAKTPAAGGRKDGVGGAAGGAGGAGGAGRRGDGAGGKGVAGRGTG